MSGTFLFWLHAPITLLLPAASCAYVGFHASRLLKGGTSRSWVLLVPVGISYLLASLALIFWGEQDRAPLEWLLRPGFFLVGFLLTATPLLITVDLLTRWPAAKPGWTRRTGN